MTGFQVKAAATTCVPGAAGAITATPSSAYIGDTIRMGLKLDNPGAQAINNGMLTLRVVNPDSGDLLMETPTPSVSVTASGQWSQNFNWTVAPGAPANALVIATLNVAGCEEVIATTTVRIINGSNPTGPSTPGAGKTKAIPVNNGTALLLLSIALGLFGAARAQRKQAKR